MVQQILTKPHILFLCDRAAVLLGIYPKEQKTYAPATGLWMFLTAAFVFAKTCMWPRHPSGDEAICKLGYYTALNRNAFSSWEIQRGTYNAYC